MRDTPSASERSHIVNQLGQFFRSRLRFITLGFVVFFSILFFGISVLSQQPVRLTVLMQALEGAQWQGIIEEFEAQNPDIQLNIVEGPNATNLIEDLYTSSFLLGDSPYDLVYMDIVWVPKFAAAGWLQDLSDQVSPEELDDFLEGDVNGGRYEGGLYRMPFRSDAGMLYYREDLLTQAGLEPPETAQELVEVSKQLQESVDADWGYVWQGRQYEGLSAMFVEVLEGFGGYWVDPDTREVGLDQQAAIDAIAFLKNTIDEGVSPPGVTTYQEEEARRLFQSGESIFMRNWPYVWQLANSDDSPVQGKIAIKPMIHAQGFDSAACQGGWGIGISRTTPHPEEAWRAIEFFTSPEIQKQFILNNGYVPSRRSLFTDPDVVAQYEFMPDLLEVVQNSVLRPPIAQYAQVSDILQRYLSAALTERMSPEDAMNAAARETRQVLGT
ncbi:MAG: ABC transporter substrate-binding protein [Thainema sp.]